jgi:sulfatase modifying factor 1
MRHPTNPLTMVSALWRSLALFAALWPLAACSGETDDAACAAGTDGCGCAAGRLCDPGLICEAGLCVGAVDASAPDVAVVDLLAEDAPVVMDVGGACEGDPVGDFCPCRDNADCASGFCLPGRDGGNVCTRTCSGACPVGYACLFVTLPNLDPTYLCVEPALNLCRPCTDDAECQRDAVGGVGARCVRYGEAEGSFCGVACAADADCPSGYACRDATSLETGGQVRQCVLADAEAECACSGRSVEGSAFTTCTVGRCEGTRACEGGGLTACRDAAGGRCEPSTEVVVTFDPQGGALEGAAVRSVSHGEPYGPLPGASREGHDLVTWRTAPAGGGEPVTAETLVTMREAHTLFAAWRGRSYVVTFDAAGGSGCEPRTVTFGATYGAEGALCAPVRLGYSFEGWRLVDDDAAGDPVTDASVVATPRDHALRAAWAPRIVTVSFDSAGGSPCEPQAVAFGATYGEAGPLCAPTREGFDFLGWHDEAGAAVTAGAVLSTPSDHTLYARWSASSFVVTWDVNGGAPCAGAATSVVTWGLPYGDAPCATSREGHAFGGWWTAACGGARVLDYTVVAMASDHTLYARWTADVVSGWVRVNPGTFTMGAPATEVGRWGTEDQVSVTLTRPFLIATTEVTQGQWRASSGGVNPSVFSACGDACPVEYVSWWSVLAYANALSRAEGLEACYELPSSGCYGAWQDGSLSCGDATPGMMHATPYTCLGYRMPTEAEWEYAARAGTTTATCGGDLSGMDGCVTVGGAGAFASGTPLSALGWYGCENDGCYGPKPVRQKAPNAWGLYDMLGNVWEWTWDRWDYKSALGGTDPARTTSAAGLLVRVRRGGGWSSGAGSLRSATRGFAWPYASGPNSNANDARSSDLGFRLVRTIAPSVRVTYSAAGGACAPATVSVNPGDAYGPAPCTPTRAGHTFGGWWTDAGSEVTPDTVVSATADHTVHARWKANTYRVSWDVSGGMPCSGAETSDVTYGAPYGTSPCATTRTGHVFAGWWTGTSGGEQVTDATPMTTAADHTLHARWTPRGCWARLFQHALGASLPANVTRLDGAWLGHSYSTRDGRACLLQSSDWNYAIIPVPRALRRLERVQVDVYDPQVGQTRFAFFARGDLKSPNFVSGSLGFFHAGTASASSVPAGNAWTAGHFFAHGSNEPRWANMTVVGVSPGQPVAPSSWSTLTWVIDRAEHTFSLSVNGLPVASGVGIPAGVPSGQNVFLFAEGVPWQVSPDVCWSNLRVDESDTATDCQGHYVTWDVNGGAPCAGASTSVGVLGAPYGPSPCQTRRAGYRSLGWFTAPTGGAVVLETTLVTVDAPHTLYARWAPDSLPAGAPR